MAGGRNPFDDGADRIDLAALIAERAAAPITDVSVNVARAALLTRKEQMEKAEEEFRKLRAKEEAKPKQELVSWQKDKAKIIGSAVVSACVVIALAAAGVMSGGAAFGLFIGLAVAFLLINYLKKASDLPPAPVEIFDAAYKQGSMDRAWELVSVRDDLLRLDSTEGAGEVKIPLSALKNAHAKAAAVKIVETGRAGAARGAAGAAPAL